MGKQIMIFGGEMALTLAYQTGRKCPREGAEGVFGTPKKEPALSSSRVVVLLLRK